MFYGFGNVMFSVVPVIVTVGFVVVFAMVIGVFISSARQKRKNDGSPVLADSAGEGAQSTPILPAPPPSGGKGPP